MNKKPMHYTMAAMVMVMATIGMGTHAYALDVFGESKALEGGNAKSDPAQNGQPSAGNDAVNGQLEIVKDNIHYKPSDDDPGDLVGFDGSTNQQILRVKIYNTSTTKPVHMKSLDLQPDGTILVTNERGDKFVFDTFTHHAFAQ